MQRLSNAILFFVLCFFIQGHRHQQMQVRGEYLIKIKADLSIDQQSNLQSLLGPSAHKLSSASNVVLVRKSLLEDPQIFLQKLYSDASDRIGRTQFPFPNANFIPSS